MGIQKNLFEQRKQLIEKREKIYEHYILNKINTINESNIKDVKRIENISKEANDKILLSINEDFINEKNEIIRETVENNYNRKKFNKLIKKEKYINKNIKYYTNRINAIENVIKKHKNIENNYVSYYCKNIIDYYLYNNIKENKERRITLGWMFIQISVLEEKYSNITKKLAGYTNNFEDVKKIREYEKIKRKLNLEKINNQMLLTNALCNNIKALKLKADEIVDNGFFGL